MREVSKALSLNLSEPQLRELYNGNFTSVCLFRFWRRRLSQSRKESIEHGSLVLSKPPHNRVLWGTGPALRFKTLLCLLLAGRPRAISTSLCYSFLVC